MMTRVPTDAGPTSRAERRLRAAGARASSVRSTAWRELVTSDALIGFILALVAWPGSRIELFNISGLYGWQSALAMATHSGRLVSTPAGWTVNWNTALVANGAYTVTAVAYDNDGRATPSPPVSVSVHNP